MSKKKQRTTSVNPEPTQSGSLSDSVRSVQQDDLAETPPTTDVVSESEQNPTEQTDDTTQTETPGENPPESVSESQQDESVEPTPEPEPAVDVTSEELPVYRFRLLGGIHSEGGKIYERGSKIETTTDLSRLNKSGAIKFQRLP